MSETLCLNVVPHARHEWVDWTGRILVCPGVQPKPPRARDTLAGSSDERSENG